MREELETLVEEVDELVSGLLADFDDGQDGGAAEEALRKLQRIVEIFEINHNEQA